MKLFIAILLSTFIFLSQHGFAQTPGTIDASYGTGGSQISPFVVPTPGYGYYSNVTTLADGKTLSFFTVSYWNDVLGQSIDSVFLLKLQANGQRDATFGNNGLAYLPQGGDKFVILPNGNILLASSEAGEVVLSRWLSNGTKDFSYNEVGKAFVGITNYPNVFMQLSDGSILIGGTYMGKKAMLVHIYSDGSRDFNFGKEGMATCDADTVGYEYVTACKQLYDGKLLVAAALSSGLSGYSFLARFNQNGKIDSTFGRSGIQKIPQNGLTITDMQLYNDQKIAVGGYYYYNGFQRIGMSIARFKPDGQPDSIFGLNGIRNTNFGGNRDFLSALSIQPDGKIIAVGNSDSKFALIRLTNSGVIDVSFNGTGKVINPYFNKGSSADGITLLADGKIEITGTVNTNDSNFAFLRTRYHTGINMGLANQINLSNLSVYPNPFSGQLTIQYQLQEKDLVSIKLFDSYGRLIHIPLTSTIQLSSTHNQVIELPQTMAKGYYYLKIESTKGTEVVKLVKE